MKQEKQFEPEHSLVQPNESQRQSKARKETVQTSLEKSQISKNTAENVKYFQN